MFSSLVIIACFLSSVGLLAAAIISILRKRRQRAVLYAKLLSAVVATYFVLLVVVSVLSPRRIIDDQEVWRFDHWGVAVRGIGLLTNGPDDDATKRVAIAIEVSNNARRATQRAKFVELYLIDSEWRRFDVSPPGQAQYVADHGEQKSLHEVIQPASSYNTVRVFDLPKPSGEFRFIVEHGIWPGRLIIGSQESFFHKQPYMPISIP